MIVGRDGIKMDPEKVRAIQEWETPATLKHLEQFIDFTGFYRRFADYYGDTILPLNELVTLFAPRKGAKPMGRRKRAMQQNPWKQKHEDAFRAVKSLFQTDIILRHFNPDREAWVEVDASNWGLVGVLLQDDDMGELRPVDFFSKKINFHECNYDIYDRELLAIVKAFEEWRPELAGVRVDGPVKVITDHKNLEYFMTTRKLSAHQARWAEFLSQFNFRLVYRPGSQARQPDALSRQPNDILVGEEDDREKGRVQVLLRDKYLSEGMLPAVELAMSLCVEEVEDHDGSQALHDEEERSLDQHIDDAYAGNEEM
jgi:hypothetical protein